MIVSIRRKQTNQSLSDIIIFSLSSKQTYFTNCWFRSSEDFIAIASEFFGKCFGQKSFANSMSSVKSNKHNYLTVTLDEKKL